MIKRFYILLFFILGFALAPNISFACESHIEKSCSRVEAINYSKEKKCLTNHHSVENDNCERNCGHKSCQCAVSNLRLLTLPYEENTNKNFILIKEEQNFFTSENYISSGFYTIWSPPNIS